MPEPLVTINGLKKYFPVKGGLLGKPTGYVKAVDGVDFDVMKGETVGVVGESGCGKTTLGRLVLRLIDADAGEVWLGETNLLRQSGAALAKMRRQMQLIFQDPYSSLDPRFTVKRIIAEPLRAHQAVRSERELEDAVASLLSRVGLTKDHLNRYPHEMSGGQRQRVAIARALALKPNFVVLDEPTSALDVSVQAQVLDLLADLQQEFGLSYLLITHNLAVVRHICDRVVVMYLGKVVEVAQNDDLFAAPLHPYTRMLLEAIPVPKVGQARRNQLHVGEVPSALNPPAGCRFHPRCPIADEGCRASAPPLAQFGDGHAVACFKAEAAAAGVA